jgi:hypothetical protein
MDRALVSEHRKKHAADFSLPRHPRTKIVVTVQDRDQANRSRADPLMGSLFPHPDPSPPAAFADYSQAIRCTSAEHAVQAAAYLARVPPYKAPA